LRTILALACLGCTPHQQPPYRLAGTDALSAADSAAVRQVASLAGMDGPYVRTLVEPYLVYGGCGGRCASYQEPGAKAPRVGLWVAESAGLTRREVRRVHDGSWSVELSLGPGVPLTVATRIIAAIRRGTLENGIPEHRRIVEEDVGTEQAAERVAAE
jgi:hypothetical protein